MYRIGIDIGGTFVKAGVVAEDYSILGRASRPTGIGRPLETVIDDIAGTARDAVAAAGLTMENIAVVGDG